jgi:hypothetical protein
MTNTVPDRLTKLQNLVENRKHVEALEYILEEKFTGAEVFVAMENVVDDQHKVIVSMIPEYQFGKTEK